MENSDVFWLRIPHAGTLNFATLQYTMKRNRFAMQADDDDDDVVLSDDEIEELEKDAAAFAGTRYGGRSTTPLQNNVVRARVCC